MIPFILFIFGALTWFAAVIEAMLAAPLVALGLAHPEGHELLGKAEYAVMLLANVFLRPLLMIFGFIAATILSSVMLWLLNYGFTQAFRGVGSPDMLRMVYFIATIVIYMSIVLTIINKSFALIYEVPSKVLRWVGGQVESTGEGAALDEVKGGASKGFEAASSGMKGTSDAVSSYGSKKQEKYENAREKQAEDDKKGKENPEVAVS
jgi:defect-in-organelle-trafficking protein DotA